MIFFTAIEKMDRENMLDLLIFLEGPGVTSYMTESLNKFMNVLPKGISNLMPSKGIQQDLDEKRLELNDYTDERLQRNLKNWFYENSGLSKKNRSDLNVAKACLQKTAETLEMKGDFKNMPGLEKVIVERYMRKIGYRIEEMILQVEPENLDKFPEKFKEELKKYSFVDPDYLLSQINFKELTSESISETIKKTLITGASIGLIKSMGFSAFILLSSAIASMGGILGITLPFFVYTGASTVLSFLLGPAGFSLIFMGISGQSIWRGNERIQRERMLLTIVVLHAILIEFDSN